MKRAVGLEIFLTDEDSAKRCVAAVDRLYPIESFSRVIEPSAGEGSFYDLLPSKTRLGIDIRDVRPEYLICNFLDWFPSELSANTLTIGNPPFGQRGSLAVRFLNHAAKFSDVVAMILPMSFNKYTFQDRVDPFLHLVESIDLADEYQFEGQLVAVKTVFQIWQRRDAPRVISVKRTEHPDFTLQHAHLSRITPEKRMHLRRFATLAIPQVGANFTPRDPETVTKGSYWFVKCSSAEVALRFEKLDFSFLTNMNTAHTSLSKADIVRAYEEVGSEKCRDD